MLNLTILLKMKKKTFDSSTDNYNSPVIKLPHISYSLVKLQGMQILLFLSGDFPFSHFYTHFVSYRMKFLLHSKHFSFDSHL